MIPTIAEADVRVLLDWAETAYPERWATLEPLLTEIYVALNAAGIRLGTTSEEFRFVVFVADQVLAKGAKMGPR